MARPHPGTEARAEPRCHRQAASPGWCDRSPARDPFPQNRPKQRWVGNVMASVPVALPVQQHLDRGGQRAPREDRGRERPGLLWAGAEHSERITGRHALPLRCCA